MEKTQARATLLEKEESVKARSRDEGKKRLGKMIQRAAWEKSKDDELVALLRQKEELESEGDLMKKAVDDAKSEVKRAMGEMERREKEREKQVEELKALMRLEKERWIEARKVEEVEKMRGELMREHKKNVEEATKGLNGLKGEWEDRVRALEGAEEEATRKRKDVDLREEEVGRLEKMLKQRSLNEMKKKEIEMKLLSEKAAAADAAMRLQER